MANSIRLPPTHGLAVSFPLPNSSPFGAFIAIAHGYCDVSLEVDDGGVGALTRGGEEGKGVEEGLETWVRGGDGRGEVEGLQAGLVRCVGVGVGAEDVGVSCVWVEEDAGWVVGEGGVGLDGCC